MKKKIEKSLLTEMLKKEMREVLKTLPIGYYFGRSLSVEIDEAADTSYITDELKIFISEKSILKSFKTDFKEFDFTEDKLERLIRGSLYHEMNHAILTPITMLFDKAKVYKVPKNVMNIVEDARINKTMRGYYLKTNFDWDKRAINNYWKPEPPENPLDLLYKAIIFNEYNVDKKYVDLLKILCENVFHYSKLIYNSRNETFVPSYLSSVSELWTFCLKIFSADPSDTDPSDTDPTDVDPSTENPAKVDPSNTDPSKDDSLGTTGEPIDEEPVDESLDDLKRFAMRSRIEDLFSEIKEASYDKKVEEVVKRQLFMKEKRLGSKKGSDYSHNGKFDHHRVPKDHIGKYDWFAREGRSDGTQFDGIKINLFIDQSGSFSRSESTINKIIKSLEEIERIDKSFSIDVITIGERNTLLDKYDRKVKTFGGNVLYPDIWDIYKQVNTAHTMCYNIVCFDGDALSMDAWPSTPQEEEWYKLGRKELAKNFAVWNHSNCYIITNRANLMYTEKHISKGHVIVTTVYANELRDQIIRCLKVMIR